MKIWGLESIPIGCGSTVVIMKLENMMQVKMKKVGGLHGWKWTVNGGQWNPFKGRWMTHWQFFIFHHYAIESFVIYALPSCVGRDTCCQSLRSDEWEGESCYGLYTVNTEFIFKKVTLEHTQNHLKPSLNLFQQLFFILARVQNHFGWRGLFPFWGLTPGGDWNILASLLKPPA